MGTVDAHFPNSAECEVFAAAVPNGPVVPIGSGGGKRDRTADLLHAMQALSQLSYSPTTN